MFFPLKNESFLVLADFSGCLVPLNRHLSQTKHCLVPLNKLPKRTKLPALPASFIIHAMPINYNNRPTLPALPKMQGCA